MGREDNGSELDSYIDTLAGTEDDSQDNGNNVADDTNTADDNQNQQDQQDQFQKLPNDQNQQDQLSESPAPTPQQAKAKGKNGQQENQQQQKKQLRPAGNGTFFDDKGNLVNERGDIIAERGFAARIHQQNQRMRSQLEERTQQLREISTQVGEVKALATSIRQYGLSNDETAQALDMAGRMKRGDVLGVAKDVLAMIAAQGYNVTDLLGADVGDTIELKAIQRMIDDRLAPITREEQARQQRAETETVARRNYNEFISNNEFAELHANDIAKVMDQFGLSPQQAYNQIRAYAYQNNIDFSQPLGPQVDALAARRNQQQRQPANQQQQRSAKPMPNGAATRVNGVVPTSAQAGADDDWASIIRGVQATLGDETLM